MRSDLGRRGRFRLRLQFGLRRPDLLGPLLLVGDPIGRLLAAHVAAEGLVLLDVSSLGRAQPARDLGFKLSRALGHAFVAHRLVLGGVRLDLRPVERDMAKLHQPCLLAKRQNLGKQSGERLQMALAEVGDGAEIRRIEPDNAHEVDPFARRLGDPARRVDPVAIGVEQQRRHHRRIERRLPAIDPVDPFDLFQIDLLDHQVQDQPRQMILGDELLNCCRQQHRFVDLPGAVALAHRHAESDSPTPSQQNPRFLRQAPRWTYKSDARLFAETR